MQSVAFAADDDENQESSATEGHRIIGKGAATVKIYPFTRKNGYKQNSACLARGRPA
jgi:hypothetical protein